MDKVRVGRSDIEVAPLGVGTMAWSNSSTWGYGDRLVEEDVRSAFETSLDAGLTFFDTAEVYGNGRSERVLGALVDGRRNELVIATKYAPYPWRLTKGQVLQALRNSLERLGVERVDLYQVHFPYGAPFLGTSMGAFAEAVQSGLTRAVGVSNYDADKMERAYRLLAREGVPLASNQVEYSLLERSPERNGLLDLCRELDVTLIAYSPLGRGALTGKYGPEQMPGGWRRFAAPFRRLAEAEPLLQAMREIGAAHGDQTPAQVALNWLARKPGVLPIPGAKNEKQARQNAAAIAWEMTAAEAERLDELSTAFLA